MTTIYRTIAAAAVSLLVAGVAVSDSKLIQSYTPQSDGQFSVECSCVSPRMGQEQCLLGILDSAAGKPREVLAPSSLARLEREIDLAAACYRKRDAANGACCESDDATSSRKFFGAKILP